uniref:Protein arginine N-methyltransferase n=1 Tax=Romanomermis culicivorax TaxID=13658 RepID=A0A915KH19_ROMCU
MDGVIFKQKRNPDTGRFEWCAENEDTTDFCQDLARAAYADMLHDEERNKLYFQALKNVIQRQKSLKNDPVHVVDIGTGTGLLSMMAAVSGADKITAIEAFEPVAIIARKIIQLNGFADKVNVISRRSTDIYSDEIAERGDIAVAEVFDTELIGENALKTFSDAQKELLKPGAKIIPCKAKFFAQPVSSDHVLNWHVAKSISLPSYNVRLCVPPNLQNCPGLDTVHDIQLSQFRNFRPILEPIEVFQFDFEKAIAFDEHKTFLLNLPGENLTGGGKLDAIFTWWELDMDGTGNLILSTKPDWSDSKNVRWRDHWIQSIYFLPESVDLTPNSNLYLNASHDEYSFWFSASNVEMKKQKQPYKRPLCTCSLHKILTRTNIARFNDSQRYERFCKIAQKIVKDKSCVAFGDCTLLPLLALQMGAKEVYLIEAEDETQKFLKSYADFNSLGTKLHMVHGMAELPETAKFGVVLADPFFASSLLPWHNLHIWRLIDDLKQFGMLTDDCQVIPNKAEICAIPVEFEHLWKIRAPVGKVEGFDLKPFDDVIQAAIKNECDQIELQPLWEYPSTALSESRVLMTFDLNGPSLHQNVHSSTEFAFHRAAKCNGIAMWMNFYFDDQLLETTGPVSSTVTGQNPKWTVTAKQSVHFPKFPLKTASNLKVDCHFDHKDEAFFKFSIF